MEMANYILSILKSQLNIVWSWGFNSPMAVENGLKFKVQGFKHNGWVVVKYNEGKDLFDVFLYSLSMELKNEVAEIYFDELVDTIDFYVERVNDYENKVKQKYSLL